MKKLFGLCCFLAITAFVRANDSSALPALIERFFPQQSQHFIFGDLPNTENTFVIKVEKDETESDESQKDKIIKNKIAIYGSDQSARNAGFGYYLRNVAQLQITDCGSNLTIPAQWKLPTEIITQTSPSRIRNAYNYCTPCYTSASWNWEQWEFELDRLALMGVNQALVLAGHEKVWQNFLRRLQVSDDDIFNFIPTCAFTGWWLMANLENHGGKVTQNIIDVEATLGRKITDRMRELGIAPIVNGFFGMVPTTLPKYIKGNFIEQGKWCGGFTRPSVLSPLDPEFSRLSKIWYEEVKNVFGEIKNFGGDLFHEGGKTGGLNLTDCGVAIQNAMLENNPDAVYVLQSWHQNPHDALIKKMKPQNTLIQQLTKNLATLRPAAKYRTYLGMEWTLNEIGNFGGNSGMYGNLKTIAELPEKLFNDAENGNVVGLGLLAEGFNNNPVMYELWADVFFAAKKIDLDAWLKNYLTARYGECTEKRFIAWQLLLRSVYNVPSEQEGVCDFVISARPGLDVAKSRFWCRNNYYWRLQDVLDAAELLLAEPAPNFTGWRFDLVDIYRQLLNAYSFHLWQQIAVAYRAKNVAEFEKLALRYLEIFADLDELMATNEFRLLGKEITDIQTKGKTPAEKALLTQTLKLLWTTWANDPGGTSLNDYASRSFAGLVKNYYQKRWEIFINDLRKSLNGAGDGKYSGSAFEENWRNNVEEFATKPIGDSAIVAAKILQKYGAEIRQIAAQQKREEQFKWKLAAGAEQILTFDVTNEIGEAGKFRATLTWQRGRNALKISKAELFEGDKIIATDKHDGYTGIKTQDNVYVLDVQKYREELTGYTLKFTVNGDNGNDSSGVMTLEKE